MFKAVKQLQRLFLAGLGEGCFLHSSLGAQRTYGCGGRCRHTLGGRPLAAGHVFPMFAFLAGRHQHSCLRGSGSGPLQVPISAEASFEGECV